MAILPRYQQAGVQLQHMPANWISLAICVKVQAMGQTISEVVGRMSDFAYKKLKLQKPQTWRRGNYGSGGAARS
jgi:regulation of enolase protein 1 (concanavalin A-like superfamily)